MRLAKLAILMLLGWSAVGHADPQADKAAAKKHIDVAKRHYNLARYDEAISEFKEAYTIDPEPSDLFNIAQAYRLKKDCENAALFYANYQREEKIKKLRDSVTKVRADMERCAKENADAAPKPVEPTPVPPPPITGTPEPGPVPGPPPVAAPVAPLPPPMEQPSDPDPDRIRRISGKVMLVGGTAFILIGILELGHVDTLDGKLKDGDCDDPMFADDNCEQLATDRTSAANGAGGALLVGSASVIVGFILWRVSMKPDRPNVTLIPRRNGAALSWRF